MRTIAEGAEDAHLYVDIGVLSKADALKLVAYGDAACSPALHRAGKRARRFDGFATDGDLDRNGSAAFAARPAVRWLRRGRFRRAGRIGLRGATTSAFSSEADIGIALDVAHGTDTPASRREGGRLQDRRRTLVARGANINPRVFELTWPRLSRSIPVQFPRPRAAPVRTRT